MKTRKIQLLVFLFLLVAISCNKSPVSKTSTPAENDKVSNEVLALIKKQGYSTDEVKKIKDGYIVENDIFLSDEALADTSTANHKRLIIAGTEQYSTNNLVKGLPKVITIMMSTSFPGYYFDALDAAIARWNNLGLKLTFQRVSDYGQILISPTSVGQSYLGLSGFPDANGFAYMSIYLNTDQLNGTVLSFPNLIVSTIQHELGHCIGLRHTDYANRSYSCPGGYLNEGQGTDGANLIPGTPSNPESTSLMLACTTGVDRTFNANDIIALNYLYGTGEIKPNPFYRYRHKNGYHYLTTDYGELNTNRDWSLEGTQCYIYIKQIPGTQPLYRFKSNGSGLDHIYIRSTAPINNYTIEGICGYVFPSATAGMVPLYQCFKSGSGYFYTTDNVDAMNSGFHVDGIVCYVIHN